MPIYEYACEKCGFTEEIIEKIDGPKIKTCPQCSADTFKRPEVSATAFHLKGGGWYKDGYSASAPKKEAKKPESSADSTSGGTTTPK